MDRGSFIRLSGATLGAAAAGVTPALAQQDPNEDVHFVCAWPAGSGADTIVRFYVEKMRPLMNRAIVVENKPGAGGNIGVEHASKAKPNGYTVLVHGGYNLASNMHLYKRPPIPSVNAFQVFATINRQAFVLTVDANKPCKNLADLTEAMKAKGSKTTYAIGAPVAFPPILSSPRRRKRRHCLMPMTRRGPNLLRSRRSSRRDNLLRLARKPQSKTAS